MNTYIDSLKRISSRYELPSELTDDYIYSICSNYGSIKSIWGFCCKDLSSVDFSQVSSEALFQMSFNQYTKWPNLFSNYDYKDIYNNGKKVGLSIEKLHSQGINGMGINIAVIDKPILSDHKELTERIKNNINIVENHEDNDELNFHGITCAAFACGNTVGVANKANLYYYAYPDRFYDDTMYWNYYFKALESIINHNERSNEKINIVSISAGIPNKQLELKEKLENYIKRLAEDNCYVIYGNRFGKDFTCSSKVYGLDPDDYDAYKLDSWQINEWDKVKVLVPSGGRTSPCNSGTSQYMYNGNQSCYSWAIPYIAGVFALASQVKKDLSFDEFCIIAKKTSIKNCNQLNILNPILIIEELLKNINNC